MEYQKAPSGVAQRGHKSCRGRIDHTALHDGDDQATHGHDRELENRALNRKINDPTRF